MWAIGLYLEGSGRQRRVWADTFNCWHHQQDKASLYGERGQRPSRIRAGAPEPSPGEEEVLLPQHPPV